MYFLTFQPIFLGFPSYSILLFLISQLFANNKVENHLFNTTIIFLRPFAHKQITIPINHFALTVLQNWVETTSGKLLTVFIDFSPRFQHVHRTSLQKHRLFCL
jgi:hypothetical protein